MDRIRQTRVGNLILILEINSPLSNIFIKFPISNNAIGFLKKLKN